MGTTGNKGKGKKPKSGGKLAKTRFAMILWLAAGLAFLTLLRLWTQPAADLYSTLGVDPPDIGIWMLFAGTWSANGFNLLIAVGVLAATVLPFMLGMKGRKGLRLYASLVVIGGLAITGTWFGLKHPLDQMAKGQAVPAAQAPR